MTKEQVLEIIKLLSALESWSFADKHHLPDYLSDNICTVMAFLEKELLS
jgi:hypothetical protein